MTQGAFPVLEKSGVQLLWFLKVVVIVAASPSVHVRGLHLLVQPR
jgi:hypothetical protein